MKKIKNKIFLKYFLFLGWFLLWSTLSFNPETFQNIKIHEFSITNYKQNINSLRGSSTIFYGVVFIIILISNLNKINLIEKIFLFWLFIFIFFLQFIPYFSNDLSIYNLYFLFNSILSLIILIFLIKYFSGDELKVIMYINFFF